jgi:hypothetical protein
MADWPPFEAALGHGATIHTFSAECLGAHLTSSSGVGSAAYPAADRAHFLPFRVNRPTLITKLMAYNGSTASGNIDVGIYSHDGTRLVSTGSTAQSGTSALQVFDVTDTWLGPGRFYLAVAMDNTTGTLFRATLGSTQIDAGIGLLIEASAFPLPATATFATISGAAAFVPIIGALVGPRTVI